MPPIERPLPRFVAEPPREGEPHGRWRQTLEDQFASACRSLEGSLEPLAAVGWFPERALGTRVYVPTAAPAEDGELFGFVAFERAAGASEPRSFSARADYTEETAERHPEWKLDLSEEVIGRWRGWGGVEGDLTLVWGTALVRGGAAVTAELGGEVVDQCALTQNGRFTLAALDAVSGFGEDLYLELALWSARGALLASESLYESEEDLPAEE
jgi:hypothetical protein